MSSPDSPHQRILDAACRLFPEDGYRVSMDAVAQQAGVSKQTVYAHFHSKDELFRATVEALVKPLNACLEPHREDIETSLRTLASAYNAHTNNSSSAALGRMLVAEAPRFPRAARQLYQSGSGAVLDRLSERLQQSMRNGELRRDDPRHAAELFLSMLDGMNSQRGLLGLRRRGRKAQDTWASHAVHVFLRAYRPHPSSSKSRSRKSP